MDEINCTFCTEFLDVDKSEFRSIFPKDILNTRFIRSSKNFICLAALGAVRPGYILLLPKKHLFSFAFLHPFITQEAQELKTSITIDVRTYFSEPIIFEHGVINAESHGGGCIDHAHLHFFPSDSDLLPQLMSEFSCRPIEHISELRTFRDQQ